MPSITEVDAQLPQTQCGECGYPGCRPYAEALIAGLAPIDRCPPGGVRTLQALGELLQIDSTPYLQTMIEKTRPPKLAVIREADCIGCTKCIQACPVDAIIGAAKHMHTVLIDECTGCGLCVEPCPVDCIDLIPNPTPDKKSFTYHPNIARKRYQAKHIRQLQQEHARQAQYLEKRRLIANKADQQEETKAKQAYILAALARVHEKKNRE